MIPIIVAAGFAAAFAGLGYFGGQDIKLVLAAGPAAGHAHIAAVVISGDMGLNLGMGGQIASRLAADGMPVIGVNSLSYFRHRRTLVEVAGLVEAVTRQALALPDIDRVVLIGQSFGADMLPTGIASLPPALRGKVALVALIVPATTAEFRASPTEMFSWGEPEIDAVPAGRALTWVPALCISGADEVHSLCPSLKQPNMQHVVLPGGHPLHRDTAAVYKQIVAAIDAAGKKATQ